MSTNKDSYRQILKSSVLVGGSQAINILITLAKNKTIAVILGPLGIGLVGVYSTFSALATVIAICGINLSSVKFIAEQQGKGNDGEVGAIVSFVRRFLFLTGLAALVAFLLLNDVMGTVPITYNKLLCYGLLGAIVFFDAMAAGERAILQGLRKLKELAKRQVFSGLLAAAFSVSVVFFLKEDGILLSLFLSSLLIYLATRWRNTGSQFASNAGLDKPNSKSIVQLGFVFLATNIWGSIMAYVIRHIILKESGIEAVGIYQSAWSFASASFNIILMALGADLYPKLAAVKEDKEKFDRTLNEQVEISLYLALPVLVGMYLMSPFIIRILYTAEFLGGVGLTRWLIWSCFLQIVCWPLNYIIIIKGTKRLLLFTTILWEIIHLPLVFLCLRFWGIDGVGVSYLVSYLIVLLGATIICARLFGFTWHRNIVKLVLSAMAVLAVMFCTRQFQPSDSVFYTVGAVLFAGTCAVTLMALQRLMNIRLVAQLSRFFKFRA